MIRLACGGVQNENARNERKRKRQGGHEGSLVERAAEGVIGNGARARGESNEKCTHGHMKTCDPCRCSRRHRPRPPLMLIMNPICHGPER
jgi:hypothetical protein